MRVENWSILLANYLKNHQSIPFEWGVSDCLIFVSDWTSICCNVDPMSYKLEGDPETIRNTYNAKIDASYLIRKHRGSVQKVMDVHFERKPLSYACRGDIVLDNNICFGIVSSGGVFFKSEEYNLIKKSLKDCKICWGVK